MDSQTNKTMTDKEVVAGKDMIENLAERLEILHRECQLGDSSRRFKFDAIPIIQDFLAALTVGTTAAGEDEKISAKGASLN